MGYTPQVATAVMYVRGKGNEPLNGYLPGYFGGDYPTATWRAVMQAVLEGLEVRGLPASRPSSTVRRPSDGHAPYTPPPPSPPQPQPEAEAEAEAEAVRDRRPPQPSQLADPGPGATTAAGAAEAAEAAARQPP